VSGHGNRSGASNGHQLTPRNQGDMSGGPASTILVVDQVAAVRDILREAMEAEGFLVVEAADRSGALSCLENHQVDLVTLGLLPLPSNWVDLAREIRERRNIPIIIVSGHDSPEDRVTGLENGADDYLVRPFHTRELILRVRNVLKRYAQPASAINALEEPQQYTFDEYVLDTQKRELRRTSGDTIDLTDFEYRLLAFLVVNSARVISRDEISKALTGHDWSPFDRSIDGHIARLRRKLETQAEQPNLIKSVRGIGYVFAGAVTMGDRILALSSVASLSAVGGVAEGETPHHMMRANIDHYLQLLGNDDLSPHERTRITKLLIEEEDRLSHDLEQLEFAESRAAACRDRLNRLERLRDRFAADSTGRLLAEKMLVNFGATARLMESLCDKMRERVNSRAL
jgi:two-component system, OmpR family, response regulator